MYFMLNVLGGILILQSSVSVHGKNQYCASLGYCYGKYCPLLLINILWFDS